MVLWLKSSPPKKPALRFERKERIEIVEKVQTKKIIQIACNDYLSLKFGERKKKTVRTLQKERRLMAENG